MKNTLIKLSIAGLLALPAAGLTSPEVAEAADTLTVESTPQSSHGFYGPSGCGSSFGFGSPFSACHTPGYGFGYPFAKPFAACPLTYGFRPVSYGFAGCGFPGCSFPSYSGWGFPSYGYGCW